MNSFSVSDASDAKPVKIQVRKSQKTISDAKPSKNIHIFEMIDSFFLYCEENVGGEDSDQMWKTEEDEAGMTSEDKIIEKGEQITSVYESIVDSNDLKSKIRKHIVKCVSVFNSKNEEALGKTYFDEYLEFLGSDDFE